VPLAGQRELLDAHRERLAGGADVEPAPEEDR
jgi:hypothetical protein